MNVRLRAINAIRRPDPSGISDLDGHHDDGSPILRRRMEAIPPGAQFDIENVDGERLIRLGAATADLRAYLHGVDDDPE